MYAKCKYIIMKYSKGFRPYVKRSASINLNTVILSETSMMVTSDVVLTTLTLRILVTIVL